jgi:hypothetical protein
VRAADLQQTDAYNLSRVKRAGSILDVRVFAASRQRRARFQPANALPAPAQRTQHH